MLGQLTINHTPQHVAWQLHLVAAGRVETALNDFGAFGFIARLVAAAWADVSARHHAFAFTPAMLAGWYYPAFHFYFMAASRYFLLCLNKINGILKYIANIKNNTTLYGERRVIFSSQSV